jgi:hypothetical protein
MENKQILANSLTMKWLASSKTIDSPKTLSVNSIPKSKSKLASATRKELFLMTASLPALVEVVVPLAVQLVELTMFNQCAVAIAIANVPLVVVRSTPILKLLQVSLALKFTQKSLRKTNGTPSKSSTNSFTTRSRNNHLCVSRNAAVSLNRNSIGRFRIKQIIIPE